MKVIVNISLKEGVLDPEGQAIKSSLNREVDVVPISFFGKKANPFIL